MAPADRPAAFPRGKRPPSKPQPSASASAPAKKPRKDAPASDKDAAHDANDDFLFGSNLGADLSQHKSDKHSHSSQPQHEHAPGFASSTSALPLGGGGVLPPSVASNGKRIPPKIESFSFAKYAKGTKVLGVIREVTEDYAVVSLPCMLHGFVRRGTSTTDGEGGLAGAGGGDAGGGAPLTQVLPPVNSVLAFYVLSTESEDVSKRQLQQNAASGNAGATKKRRIELSPLPIHVNRGVNAESYLASALTGHAENMHPMVVRGRIASVEDHGCLVDVGSALGASGRRAFVRFDQIEGEYEVDEEEESGDDGDEDANDNGSSNSDGNNDNNDIKRKLNVDRIYDFTILPSNLSEPSTAIVQLALPLPSTLSTLPTPSTAMPSLPALQPGMLTEVRVEAYARNGLCVCFHEGVYRGSVDEDHLGGWRGVDFGKKKEEEVWWKGVFKGRHARFAARIIAVDAATKVVRFTLRPHLLALDGALASFPYAVGTVVKDAQVVRVDPGVGALLALPSIDEAADAKEGDDEEAMGGDEGEGTRLQTRADRLAALDQKLGNRLLSVPEYRAASQVRTAYVHISKSMDVPDDGAPSKKKGKRGQQQRTPESLFARHFGPSRIINALRILSTSHLLDGVASCATAPSIVNAHVLTHADVHPGRVYDRVPVLRLLDSGGILVDLGCGVRGIVPASHLFDKSSHGALDGTSDVAAAGYRQKVRLAKYKVGNAVTVRCLTVDPTARSCVLTAKKTLVSTDLSDPIVDYPSLAPGRVAAGYITKVDATGLTVTFYNNVHGRVSSRSLASELGVEDVRVNYAVGDAVVARVVACERRRNRHCTADDADEDRYYYRLSLSLKTVVEEKAAPQEGKDAAATSAGEKGAVPLAAGAIVAAKRMKVLQMVDCLLRDDGAFLPGYAVVAIKSKFFAGSFEYDAVECKLPYDQLLDSYSDRGLSHPPVELDAIAREVLTVGKRVDAAGLVLSVPYNYGGTDALPVVSLKPSLVATVRERQDSAAGHDDLAVLCPAPRTHLFMGLHVRGCVARIDPRYGAFVRFLDGLTGLIPKTKKGCDEKLYDTILCRVTALDVTSSPPKILLKKVTMADVAKKRRKSELKNKGSNAGGGKGGQIQVGDVVGDVKVADINFARAKVYLLDGGEESSKVRARIHVTMAAPAEKKAKLSKKEKQFKEEHKIGKCHPFYSWKVGDIITDVRCVAVDNRDGVAYVELANLDPLPSIVSDPTYLPPGAILSAIVTSVSTTPSHQGVWVQVCPGISGFVPALELSTNPDVLNDLEANYKVGSRLTCCVLEGRADGGKKKMPSLVRRQPQSRLHLQTGDDDHHDATKCEHQAIELSVLLASSGNDDDNRQNDAFKPTKPHRGELVVGRINTKSRMIGAPSLMLNLRGGFVGRCCITELADVDGWENMPLGKAVVASDHKPSGKGSDQQQRVVSDSDADHSNDQEEEDDDASGNVQGDYPDGKYVKCRVLGNVAGRSKGTLELSLRDSRCLEDSSKSNLEDDAVPDSNEMVHAYVVSTTKKGCFVRLSRKVEGRVILKELSDDFIPNPSVMFPPGRLVVGKVKAVKESNNGAKVDMDLRESVLLSSGDRLAFDDIEENGKYTGVITRVETYGVFVRIDNSDVSGLAHVSECSDNFIKNLDRLYNPGDPVKLMVIKLDTEQKRLGFSLKASNFVDDSDDDDSSTSSGEGSESESDAMDEDSVAGEIDSEDEDFASKLAKKMEAGDEDMEVDDDASTDGDDSGSSDGSASDSGESEASDSEDEDEPNEGKQAKDQTQAMETDVGFDWGGASSLKPIKSSKLADSSDESSSDSSDEESDDEEDADSGFKSSHRSRKKAAAKRREEEETSRREAALADGTADEVPETSADFERLVAGSPNSSEIWIRYMAFHLSLADIDSARNVANRAFERIEFRQEGEKLNVWTALLTLELKYGTDKSLHQTVDRACQQNNPKKVYLRVCELLDKEVDAAASASGSSDLDTATARADEMFKKMCKKFSSKKSVWLAHFKYLLKGSRHEEAHALLKRSLQSLPTYKHVEVMSKFGQMEFEMGSPERGRTIFGALLEKHPKRMDLLFVHIDKEIKNGDIAKARALFDSVVHPVSQERKFKFSDKQMKSLFKKWYRMEEDHGDDESQERVKEEARSFVNKAS